MDKHEPISARISVSKIAQWLVIGLAVLLAAAIAWGFLDDASQMPRRD